MKTQGLPSGVWQMSPSATTGGETGGCGPAPCLSGCPNSWTVAGCTDSRGIGNLTWIPKRHAKVRRYTGACCIGPDVLKRRTDHTDQTTGRGGKRIGYGSRFENQRDHGSKAGVAELAGWCLLIPAPRTRGRSDDACPSGSPAQTAFRRPGCQPWQAGSSAQA